MTLEENTELLYMVSAFYAPDSERCVRWDDPRFAIQWPMEPTVISERDAQAPLFSPDYHLEGIMEAMDC
jgi:dTDP-4-dehydrorhamnose 3,5-epimerase